MRLGQSGLTVCVLALLLLAGCQVGGSGITEREGYFSWVDEQGRVRYSRIPEAQHQGAVKGEQIVAPVSASDEIVEPEDDRAHSESARGAAAKLEENLEYTTENYPDGEELAKKGFIRPGQRQPYFTWRDANGIVRVSYYTPDMRTEEQKQAAQAPVILSDATVYLPAAVNGHTPVEGYDPDAFAILGVEDTATFFSVFAETCCQTLPARDFQEWQKDREFGVRFDDDTPRHSFSTGDSPYRLISLPSSTFVPGFVMRLRSYAHNGVLVPSLAFLDRDLKPVRIVTDIVMNYEPENWRRRGYLESWVPVFPGQGERWLVIFTRPQDLAGQTVLESGDALKVIPHIETGEIGVTILDE